MNGTVENRIRVKAKLVEQFGGGCQRCGYNRCMRALQFHHVDSSEKDRWSNGLGSVSLDEIKSHPDRFLLLCANCHFEEHEKIDEETRTYVTCHCGKKFRAKQSRIDGGKDKHCSRECHQSIRLKESFTKSNISSRFWSKVNRNPESGCWNWIGSFVRGNGVMTITHQDGKHIPKMAGMISYFLRHGFYPKKKIRRLCKNPACVNPDHFA